MKTQKLNTLFIILIIIMIILFAAIVLINAFDKEESKVGGLKDITGAVQKFEVHHGTSNPQYVHVRTTKKYDDKYFEYLEHIKDRRDETFFR